MTHITLNHITKIEGHAKLDLKINNGKVEVCNLGSTEGARFFEGIIKGKSYDEAYEICSRICGICSCGHTVAGLHALEAALGVTVSKQTKLLRELLTIGERIRSHLSHLYFFVLPDYMGYESALAMVPHYKKEVATALRITQVGNELVSTIGGREMHPFASIVGGFTQIPEDAKLKAIANKLKAERETIVEIVRFFSKLNYPAFSRKTRFLSLRQKKGFPLLDGNIVSDDGLEFSPQHYHDYIEEYIVKHSTAKFAVAKGKEYMTGALARINNNLDQLSPAVKKLIKESNISFPSTNIFHNNFAQALETLHWTDKAIDLIDHHTFKHEDPVKVTPRAGHGIAAIEVPRGILFHEYTTDDAGEILEANIITPTVQNLANAELDIRAFVEHILKRKKLTKPEIVLEIEKLIRAYDPCFSCSTHFLKVTWLDEQEAP
ncbi:MAG: Ni/Fe hydrogenase subunit alpha [Candidatus Woesearchaeota archaeon]|nr:MAG: Ni/Fe hydrogenase subunit alpha [Candidatus Woesearchaeota archaeon]